MAKLATPLALLMLLVPLGFGLTGCGGSEPENAALPTIMRQRIQTEMRTILRDLKVAEEQAAVLEGRYLELEPLRARYFNRPVREGYRLTLSEVSAGGFRAEVVHAASGLRCQLRVAEGGAGSGVPTCGP